MNKQLRREHADKRHVVLDADDAPVTTLADETVDGVGIEDAIAADLRRRHQVLDIVGNLTVEEDRGTWRAIGLLVSIGDRR